jgi:hypothetical protein
LLREPARRDADAGRDPSCDQAVAEFVIDAGAQRNLAFLRLVVDLVPGLAQLNSSPMARCA